MRSSSFIHFSFLKFVISDSYSLANLIPLNLVLKIISPNYRRDDIANGIKQKVSIDLRSNESDGHHVIIGILALNNSNDEPYN